MDTPMEWSTISTTQVAAATFSSAWWLAGPMGILAFLGAWWLWWRLPKRQVDRLRLTIRDARARAEIEDSLRKTMSQLFGGAAALAAAIFAYLQFSQQERSAHDLLISNQVSKGFELIGDKEILVRVGGLYALEGVMNTSDQYRRPVLQALCGFVRERTRREMNDGPPAVDIQTALTVIARRRAETGVGERSPDLRNARIAKADLSGAHLDNAWLSGAWLSGADLSSASLRGAGLASADLTGAYLWGTDLTHADLVNSKLIGANLGLSELVSAVMSGANLSGDLTGANLSGANLSGSNLTGAKLSGANLGFDVTSAVFGAKPRLANLTGANLSDADLSGAKGLAVAQLDKACGTNVKLDAGLTIKPCPRISK